MSQATIVLPTAGTVSGLAQTQNANAALDAIATGFAGASAPSEHEAFRTWYDTANGVKMRRKADDTGYVLDGSLDESGFSSRSSNTILGLGDLDRPIRITASITQTLTAAATLGAKWRTGPYRIESGATVIFDPNGSETINGATTLTIVGPADGFIFCNGSAFYTTGFASVAVLTNPSNTSQTLTYAAPVNWDMNLGAWGVLTATGSPTMAAPTHMVAGGHYVLRFIQDATGGRAVTWNAVFIGRGTGAMPQPNNQPNSTTMFVFESDGTNLYLTNVNRTPLVTTLTSGSGTFTSTAGATRQWARLVGAGGGGYGNTVGGAGGNTTFGSLTANGGAAGVGAGTAIPAAATASGGNLANISGGTATNGNNAAVSNSGNSGANSYLGGAGGGGSGTSQGVGAAGAANSGAGGGSGGSLGGAPGQGGNSGAYCEHLYVTPIAASYSYSVGAGGSAGGGAGSNGAGGAGGSGGIVVVEYFD